MGFRNEHLVPTEISRSNPVIVTIANHGLVDGQRIRATRFVSTPQPRATGMQQLNNRLFVVKYSAIDTFALFDIYDQPIDGTNYTPFVFNGTSQFTLTGPDLFIQNTGNQ